MKLLTNPNGGDGTMRPGVMIPIPQYPLYSATLAEYNLKQVKIKNNSHYFWAYVVRLKFFTQGRILSEWGQQLVPWVEWTWKIDRGGKENLHTQSNSCYQSWKSNWTSAFKVFHSFARTFERWKKSALFELKCNGETSHVLNTFLLNSKLIFVSQKKDFRQCCSKEFSLFRENIENVIKFAHKHKLFIFADEVKITILFWFRDFF